MQRLTPNDTVAGSNMQFCNFCTAPVRGSQTLGWKSNMDGKQPSDMVFVSQSGQPYTRYRVHRLVARNAQRVACLADRNVALHRIRHSIARYLLQAGVGLNTIRAWLGHVSLDTTKIYKDYAELDTISSYEPCRVTHLSF